MRARIPSNKDTFQAVRTTICNLKTKNWKKRKESSFGKWRKKRFQFKRTLGGCDLTENVWMATSIYYHLVLCDHIKPLSPMFSWTIYEFLKWLFERTLVSCLCFFSLTMSKLINKAKIYSSLSNSSAARNKCGGGEDEPFLISAVLGISVVVGKMSHS